MAVSFLHDLNAIFFFSRFDIAIVVIVIYSNRQTLSFLVLVLRSIYMEISKTRSTLAQWEYKRIEKADRSSGKERCSWDLRLFVLIGVFSPPNAKRGRCFLVACYATLKPALSVRRSVGPSVGPSHFTFSASMGFLAFLLLPKCSTDLNYGPCPPARD